MNYNKKYVIAFFSIFLLFFSGIFLGNTLKKEEKKESSTPSQTQTGIVIEEKEKNNKLETGDIKDLKDLVIKNKSNVKKIESKDLNLQEIKETSLYLEQKKKIENKLKLPSNLLTKFLKENEKIYKKMVKEKIVNKKPYIFFKEKERKIFYKRFPDYNFSNFIVFRKKDLYKYNKNIKYNKIEKEEICASVFGKKKCSEKEITYIQIKKYKIKKEILEKILKNKRISPFTTIIFLKKKKGKYYDKYLIFNKTYGVYGKEFLERYKKAISKQNYKFLFLLLENNIKTLEDVYEKDFLNIYDTIFKEL